MRQRKIDYERTSIVVDLSPSLPKELPKREEVLGKLVLALSSTYPDLFTHRGKHKGTKLLQLAIEVYKDRIVGRKPGSLLEYAKRLGWGKKSRGKICEMFKRLEEIEFTVGRKFNDEFFLRLFGDAALNFLEAREVLGVSSSLLGLIPDSQLDPTSIVGSSFTFKNIGRVILALEFVLTSVREGDEIYLVLRDGSTWGSKGFGNYMRLVLQRVVRQKRLKLRVLASPEIKAEMLTFVESVGGTIVIDSSLEKEIGNMRFFYVGEYIVTIDKSPHIKRNQKVIFSGSIRKTWLNEKKEMKRKFERLSRYQSKMTL